MKLKLGELRPMMDVLPEVIDREGLPSRATWWLGRALGDIQREFEPFEKARQNLIKKYATTDEEGEFITKQQGDLTVHVFEDQPAFEKEVSELSDEEIEIKYKPLSVDQLGTAQIKGTEFLKLGRLITEPSEEADEADEPEPLTIVE